MKLTIMLWNTQLDEATHRKIHIANNILKEDVIGVCAQQFWYSVLFLYFSTLSSLMGAY